MALCSGVPADGGGSNGVRLGFHTPIRVMILCVVVVVVGGGGGVIRRRYRRRRRRRGVGFVVPGEAWARRLRTFTKVVWEERRVKILLA